MPPSGPWRVAALAGALCVAPAAGWTQAADPGHDHEAPRVGVGGELTATLSRRDRAAWFNYTDYERDALRIARIRLFGEWRPAARLSVVAELRTENANDLTAAAFYARWKPVDTQDFTVHAGRIPPVIGAFARHAYGRDNLVAGLPLAYQYLTSLRPDALPERGSDILRMRARGWQSSFPVGSATPAPGIPLISGSRWDTGISATWRRGWIEAAAAATVGSPAIPTMRETNTGRQWSGRLATHLPQGLSVGLSAARAPWIEDDVLRLVPEETPRRSNQTVLGVDAEFGRGPWLVRHEWWQAAFDVPLAAEQANVRLGAWSAFIEGRYRFHPRWQSAVRLERLSFSDILADGGLPTSWDADVDRAEVVLGFRATRYAELRIGYQQNWRDGGRVRVRGFPTLSLIYWF
jgi:hypothetical protein